MLKFRRITGRSAQSKEGSKASSNVDTSITNSHSSKATATPPSPRPAASDPYSDFRNRGPFPQTRPVPVTETGRIQAVHEITFKSPDGRAKPIAAQRPIIDSSDSDNLRIVGREEERRSSSRGRSRSHSRSHSRSKSQSRGRSQSTGRRVDTSYEYNSPRRRSKSATRASDYRRSPDSTHMSAPSISVDSSEDENKKRKSKMEKIRQLQAKNELYKEEFKKVQKDRKKLKKDLELKTQEMKSLTDEIDAHILETSRLKSQLSEVMMYLDRKVDEEGKDKHAMKALQKELESAKSENQATFHRISELKSDLRDLKEYVRRKDEQLEALTTEVSDQQKEIMQLEDEKKKLVGHKENGQQLESTIISQLDQQKSDIKAELAATVKRATKMVQEREEAIGDLLKENDELKRQLVTARSESHAGQVSQEEIDHLRDDLQRTKASLEQAQDRNVLLEEEIEQWISRGSEMEGMLERLDKDVETWRGKANEAHRTLETVQSQLEDAESKAATHREALQLAQAKFEADIVALKEKHNASIADIEARAFAERVEKPNPSQQALLLEQAVAKQKDPSKQGPSWRKFLAGAGSEDGSEVGDRDKRVKELHEENQAQSEEIKNLKSELVRLRSAHNDALYMSKKKIEQLEEENKQRVERIHSLEEQLHEGSAFEKYLKERQASQA